MSSPLLDFFLEYTYDGNLDFLYPSHENNLRLSSFSSLFESFMAIGFGFFALARENSTIVQIMEAPFQKLIKKLKFFQEQIKGGTSSLTTTESLKFETNLSTMIGKNESLLKEIFFDIRYNFLCLGTYCCLMLICCGIEDLLINGKEQHMFLKNFVFNYSAFVIFNFVRRVRVNDSIEEEKNNLAKELMLYLLALILSLIFSFSVNSPMPMAFLTILILLSIFFPVLIHGGQYLKLKKDVAKERALIAQKFTFGEE